MENKKKMNIGVLALCLVPNLANADTLFTCKSCYNKPANSYYISSGTNTSDCAWACFSGYVKKGNNCCVEKPANATYTDSAQCNWSCNSNYTKVGNFCCPNGMLPSNAYFSGGSCSNWACNSGYKKIGGKCLSCDTNCAVEIIDITAVSTGNSSSSRGSVNCGTIVSARTVYGGKVVIGKDKKVIGWFSCKTTKNGKTCDASPSYYICKDKLIEM